MLREFCCEDMAFHALHRCGECESHGRGVCPDAIVCSSPHGLFGIPIHDGGSSFVQIFFCPWCAQDLRPQKTASGFKPRQESEQT